MPAPNPSPGEGAGWGPECDPMKFSATSMKWISIAIDRIDETRYSTPIRSQDWSQDAKAQVEQLWNCHLDNIVQLAHASKPGQYLAYPQDTHGLKCLEMLWGSFVTASRNRYSACAKSCFSKAACARFVCCSAEHDINKISIVITYPY